MYIYIYVAVACLLVGFRDVPYEQTIKKSIMTYIVRFGIN